MSTAVAGAPAPATTMVTVVRLPLADAGPVNPVERVQSIVARVDLALADVLHAGDAIRPYSVVVRRHALDAVALDDALAAALLRGEPAARLVTRHDLLTCLAADTPARLRLAFTTPTHFRAAGYEHQLPDTPSLVASLAARWEARALPALPRIRAQRAGVWPLALRWEQMATPHGVQRGFVGVVHVELRALDPDERRALVALARFGAWAGVGKHTTAGMGRMLVLGEGDGVGRRRAPWDAA